MIIRFHDTLPETADGANQLPTQTGYEIVTVTYLKGHADEQKLAEIKLSGDL
ncbi:MAG: hypothetical protein NTW28_31005 [Candidatus Solibacter sp.]|nr:hypothetical protein [Candidatus Solibacter sp.]